MKGHQLFAAARYFVLFCVLFMAEPVKGAAADSPMVKYCYNDWRPYTFTRGDQPAGLSVEIMREATRRIGAEAELSELPWKRCLDLVAKGQMDAVMDAASRPQFVHGEVSYSIYSDTFWTLADAGINRFSWDLVRGKSVGLVNGYQYGAALTDNLAKANVRIVYSYDDPANIRMLTGGRVHLIVGDFVGTRLYGLDNDLDIRPLLPSPSFDRLYPSFNKNRRDTMLRIDGALKAMIEDGSIDRAYRRHLGIGFADILEQGRVKVPSPAE